MSWHVLPEAAEVFTLESYLDGLRSARSNPKSGDGEFCSRDKPTELSRSSRSGMTLKRFAVRSGKDLSILSRADSPARISPSPENSAESTASELDSGARCCGLFAKYAPGECLWKTCPSLFSPEESPPYSGRWPRSGMTRNGFVYRRNSAGQIISEIAPGYLPTPTATGHEETLPAWKKRRARNRRAGLNLWVALQMIDGHPGRANPRYVEWMMGWPDGATDLKPLDKDGFHSWLLRHTGYLSVVLAEIDGRTWDGIPGGMHVL